MQTAPTEVLQHAPYGRGWSVAFTAVLMTAFLVECLAFIRTNSQTFDEANHLAAGYSYLDTGDFRLNPEHPPLIKELLALPVYLFYSPHLAGDDAAQGNAADFNAGREFLYGSGVSADTMLALARLSNVVLGLLLLVAIARWSYRLSGASASVLATALAAVDPNLIAHASLVTMDLGATLFVFLACYFFWEYASPHPQLPSPQRPGETRRSLWWIAAAGVPMGLALATKFSMVLLPCLTVPLFILHEATRAPSPHTKGDHPRNMSLFGWALRHLMAPILVMLAVAAVVVSLAYLGDSPASWWAGLNKQLDHLAGGHRGYFLGEYSTSGWTWYFPAALLVKTPLGTLLLLCCAVVARAGERVAWPTILFFVAPPLLFMAVMIPTTINIGLRYVLPVYPFMLVAAGSAALYSIRWAWAMSAFRCACVLMTVAASAHIAPHYLAFFNVIAGGPLGGPQWLLDSNLDWGQDLKSLKRYMDRAGLSTAYLSYFGTAPPVYYGIRFQYLPSFSPQAVSPSDGLVTGERRELLVISVNNLYGVYAEDHDFYRWLQDRPRLDHIGYSLYVYDITNDASAHLELARCYSKVGMMTQLGHEALRVLAIDPSNTEASALLRDTAQGTK